MDRFGWVPSVGGNISVRLDAERIAITRSGGRKGFLTREGVMVVDLHGASLTEGGRPSAETGLHCQIYRAFPDVGAVLHGHSIAATVLSRVVEGDGIVLSGYEMIKAFAGQTTHEARVVVPLLDNDQDIDRLSGIVAGRLNGPVPGYVLRGHGVYAWGRDADQALMHLEALEFLLDCEFQARKIN
ncbi:methylthioribulose 1-phosphate dehydratase [Acetobacteraceae bacterium KSS8]|uniref:Methylthioribulose-1-phosphate dehydratase n=2 Tax=Endosaccharibacter trunci TaxID=2812733 RepID=A0ABT1W7F1_9PROT|nr:methylthioribulose 1-phosphate dehydratase [Acetobacteraceae bacterium KSS8]